jgi:hypothetical protein
VHGLGDQRRCLVVAARGHQRRDPDLSQAGDDVPILERADHVEFARSVHGEVDLGVAVDRGKGALHILRWWVDPADVSRVEGIRGGLVFRAFDGSCFLVIKQGLLYVRGKIRTQPVGFFHPLDHAGG